MRKYLIVFLLLATQTFTLACHDKRYTPVLYYWPTYYEVVRSQVFNPDDFVPQESAKVLIDTYYTATPPKSVPPGLNIYIGYLLLADGQQSEAIKYFKKEAELFPESKIWVDRIIKDAKK